MALLPLYLVNTVLNLVLLTAYLIFKNSTFKNRAFNLFMPIYFDANLMVNVLLFLSFYFSHWLSNL